LWVRAGFDGKAGFWQHAAGGQPTLKVLILDGSAGDDAIALAARGAVHRALEPLGAAVREFVLADVDIAPCAGDFKCWLRSPGVCAIDDANREIARRHVQSDAVIFLTPVTFGGYSSALKKAVDHLIPNISPLFRVVGGETHHRRRYSRYPRLVVAGILPAPDPDSERIFESLARRNALNMDPPGWACGVLYRREGVHAVDARMAGLLARAEVRA
jgi:hypothetical protein